MQPLPKWAHSFLPGFKYFVSHQAGFFCRKVMAGVHDYRITTGGGILLPEQYPEVTVSNKKNPLMERGKKAKEC